MSPPETELRHTVDAERMEWPMENTVFLTLDLERDYGTALPETHFEALDGVQRLASLLEQFNVPLTCFVQTEVLETRPEAVNSLVEAAVDVSFHPHSHTHMPRAQTQVRSEIERATEAFREFFGRDPVGYRFPNGNIQENDYSILSEFDYGFDASVFPTWRPGHFDNLDLASTPSYFPGLDLYELPFTVFSDRIPIPTSISYSQVLGSPYSYWLKRRPPSVMVVNIHMHDLVTPSTKCLLPLHYRLLYSRRPNGLQELTDLLQAFSRRGLSFMQLDDVHRTLRQPTQ